MVFSKRMNIAGIAAIILLLNLFHSTHQQSWRNDKIVRQYSYNQNNNNMGNTQMNYPMNNNNNNNNQMPSYGGNNNNAPMNNGGGAQSNQPENLITGLQFDCSTKTTGPNKDPKYCDVFHACVYGQLQKSYGCPQIGDRFYFDETTKRCDFSKNNPSACPSNSYYQQLVQPPTQAGVNYNSNDAAPTTSEPVEPWKQYVRANEQFACAGKQDGFYSSRWCNVFYRCFTNVKTEFLCAKQSNGDRLWWAQHSQAPVPQQTAQCQYPCDSGRQCSSPGGILVENGQSVSDGLSEAAAVYQRNCAATPAPFVPGQPGPQDNSNDLFRLPENENNCAGQPDGTFVSSKYCNVFHVCFAGKRSDFECAKASHGQYDLWWNDATKRCEWPCKVQCSKPLFGNQQSSQQVQQLDRNINAIECGGGAAAGGQGNNQYGGQQQYGQGNNMIPGNSMGNQNYGKK